MIFITSKCFRGGGKRERGKKRKKRKGGTLLERKQVGSKGRREEGEFMKREQQKRGLTQEKRERAKYINWKAAGERKAISGGATKSINLLPPAPEGEIFPFNCCLECTHTHTEAGMGTTKRPRGFDHYLPLLLLMLCVCFLWRREEEESSLSLGSELSFPLSKSQLRVRGSIRFIEIEPGIKLKTRTTTVQ